MGFSKQTLALLHEAGWWKDRELDKEEIEAYFVAHDYPVYPAVVDFFSEFGGLEIGNAVDIARIGAPVPNEVMEYHLALGNSFLPIGESSQMYLYISEKGQIYGIPFYTDHDNCNYFVGKDAVEAIDALCSNAKLSKVQFGSKGQHI